MKTYINYEKITHGYHKAYHQVQTCFHIFLSTSSLMHFDLSYILFSMKLLLPHGASFHLIP